jgi:hypothetical protein
MIPIRENTHRSVLATLDCVQEIQERLADQNQPPIKFLRGDADAAFGVIVRPENEALIVNKRDRIGVGSFTYVSNEFMEYLDRMGISLYLSDSPYTNKSRIVDRVIRTIRDRFGEEQSLMINIDLVDQAVAEYNNAPHTAFYRLYSPNDVQNNVDLEEYFIRESQYKLNETKKLQERKGLLGYQPGNILLIHHDQSKLAGIQPKARRKFNKLAIFDRYEYGNVVCRYLGSQWIRRGRWVPITMLSYPITIPVQFTKYIAPNISLVPREYFQLVK